MRRFFVVAGALILVAAFTSGYASADSVDGQMRAAVNNIATENPFGCDTALGGVQAGCVIHNRMYGALDPREVNGAVGPVDGFPLWKAAPNRYLGDGQATSNYPNATQDTCRPWYSVWDAATAPTTSLYISYYGTQSQLINQAEVGTANGQNSEDCTAGGAAANACFGAIGTTFGDTATGSAQGTLNGTGGLAPVPVPTVVTNGAGTNVATLSIVAAELGNTLNLPSGEPGAVCENGPVGAKVPTFFDDLTDTNAPSAIYGLGLYVYSIPAGPGGVLRNLNDLEGASSLQALLSNPSAGMACTSSDPVSGDCPNVHMIPCASLGGATCLGDLMAPAGGTFTVAAATVDAALGSALGSDVAVFLTKVFYRGSVVGSNADPAANFVDRFNPSLVSLFSAASTRVSYDSLAARVSFTRIDASGNRVVIGFETVGGSFASFTIQRADDGISFVDLGIVAGTGETSYSFTDTIRGRRPASATYRIIAEDFDGNLTQIFQSVDLSTKPSRGGSRR